jgi:hypothetical protein
MTNMNQQDKWKQWNYEGLIPGPTESEEDFNQRVFFCQHLKQKLFEHLEIDLPFDEQDLASQEILKEALQETEQIYGIAPYWTPLIFNNYQLAPWHGGCAWIFQLNEHSPTAAFLQLRAQFKHKSGYLGLYHRKELIAHELAHVGRMMYTEPQFEEILAYRTSPSFFRRFLGGMIQTSKESLFFILLLGVVLMAHLAILLSDISWTTSILLGVQALPIFFLFLAFIRVIRKQKILDQCQKKLVQLFQDHKVATHVLYRLLDSEITLFARSSVEDIRSFIDDQATKNFRWKFLMISYERI